MTDLGDQLMQGLLNKDLSEWSAQEIDSFIVDAYLSLLKSMRDKLYTTSGLLVEPDMNVWGDEKDEEDGIPTTCVACLAGAFFVSKVGCLIPDLAAPFPFEPGISSMNVLRFLDGLRYLEEDEEDGIAISQLLETMGYEVPLPTDYACTSHLYGEKVASKLERFIQLNPRLSERLRQHTED